MTASRGRGGESKVAGPDTGRTVLLPAQVGMDRVGPSAFPGVFPEPHAGGGESARSCTRSWTCVCSPQTRGWSYAAPKALGQQRLLPMLAGMSRPLGANPVNAGAAPHARRTGFMTCGDVMLSLVAPSAIRFAEVVSPAKVKG